MKSYSFSVFFFLIFIVSACVNSPKSERILIVADEWPQMHALAQIISEHKNVEIDSVEQAQLDSNLTDYDVVFMYMHKVLEKNSEQALIHFVNRGGKLIVLHHGLASAKMKNPDWLEFAGMKINPPGEELGWKVLNHTTHTMVNLAPGHFITTNKINYTKEVYFDSDNFKGDFPAFDLPDTEIFLNQQFTNPREKKVLFGVLSQDNNIMQATSGWYQKNGNGWFFYFQAGHQIADFENAKFQQVILNTLDWNPNLR